MLYCCAYSYCKWLSEFSTPLPLAYIAACAADISAGDLVLDPSAGNGALACFAHNAGAKVCVNEIDPLRLEILKALFANGQITAHDGEFIDDLLPHLIAFDAVLINPPFSSSLARSRARATLSLACAI